MAIESVSNQTTVQQTSTLASGEQVTTTEIAQEILPLISESNNLNVESTRRTDETATKTETKDAPELEDADLLTALNADLEALIALLQAEQDEKQIEAAKERIEALNGQLDAHHEDTMAKVEESLKAMEEQEKASLANKILGWISVAVAVVVAVAMVATVGGAAAGLAVVGAAIGLATQVLNETGAMDKIVEAMADSIQDDFGCSSTTAKAWAQGIMGAIGVILSVACMVGGNFASAGTGLANVTAATVKAVRVGTTIATSVTSAASVTSSGVATGLTYEADEKSAEVTKTNKLLKQLQTMLDQEEEDLQQLLEQLTNALDQVVELLDSKQDTLNKISAEIGA